MKLTILMASHFLLWTFIKAGLFGFSFVFYERIQHCFICRPSDSTVSEDAGRTVATTALAFRRSNQCSARFHPLWTFRILYSLGVTLPASRVTASVLLWLLCGAVGTRNFTKVRNATNRSITVNCKVSHVTCMHKSSRIR
jgi:hypothetical protein